MRYCVCKGLATLKPPKSDFVAVPPPAAEGVGVEWRIAGIYIVSL